MTILDETVSQLIGKWGQVPHVPIGTETVSNKEFVQSDK